MTGLRLYKIEKLCSEVAISRLFGPEADPEAGHALAYPWRAVWRVNDRRDTAANRFLISVPKRRMRSAVGRVLMRRRCREAYRLSRSLLPAEASLDMAFIFVGKEPAPYAATLAAIRRLLGHIARSISTDN